MNNYRGYFFNCKDCEHRYRVDIITDEYSPDFTEIELAANPCMVTYDSQQTPFEPIMYSHMEVSVISGDWLFDIYSQDVQSVQAYLYREGEDEDEVVWCGFVTNNLLNMPQDGCTNTFSINCDDCLCTLQNYDYRVLSNLDDIYHMDNYRQIVPFTELIRNIADRCKLIMNVTVDASLYDDDDNVVQLEDLKISEKNFFSDDAEEVPWKFSEVLEELCRWLGTTAVQEGDTLYLFDRQSHSVTTPTVDTDVTSYYNAFLTEKPFIDWEYDEYTVRNIAYRNENVGGSGNTISMETVYNSVQVKDSFYEISEFVPDLYDDDRLENNEGDVWKSIKLPVRQPSVPKYINKKNKQTDDADDNAYDYYMKQWTHDWYTPVRYVPGTMVEATYHDMNARLVSTSHTGSDISFTTFTAQYTIKNMSRQYRTVNVQIVEHYGAEEGGTYYLSNIAQRNLYMAGHSSITFNLTLSGFHQSTRNLTPRFRMGNGEWVALGQESGVYGRATLTTVTSEIVDIASVSRPKDEGFYDRQIQDSVSWDRYLMISQMDKPAYLLNPRNVTPVQALDYYLPVMRLNDNYRNPMILTPDSFIAINGTVKIERYCREYINPNWTGDSTGIGGDYNSSYYGIITGLKEIWTFPLALWFQLKIGRHYWNGTEWTETASLFSVDVSTNVDEDGYIDFSKLWNNDFDIINNISYEEYSGASGYKIPVVPALDFNAPIKFSVNLPSRVQQYTGNVSHDGMNGSVYIKDLSIELFAKGAENTDLSDVVYENDRSDMNELSDNTFGDITCRFTTYPGEGHNSYSNVGYGSGLAGWFRKAGLDEEWSYMEENIVKTYVNQYGTSTISQQIVMDMSPSVISRIKDTDMDRFFHITGMSIDFANGTKTLDIIESKEYNEE